MTRRIRKVTPDEQETALQRVIAKINGEVAKHRDQMRIDIDRHTAQVRSAPKHPRPDEAIREYAEIMNRRLAERERQANEEVRRLRSASTSDHWADRAAAAYALRFPNSKASRRFSVAMVMAKSRDAGAGLVAAKLREWEGRGVRKSIQRAAIKLARAEVTERTQESDYLTHVAELRIWRHALDVTAENWIRSLME